MFGNMGQMLRLMKDLPKIKEEMAKFQERLPDLTAEGASGGGMVTAKVNGKMQLQSLQLSDEVLALKDREMLEDLIVAAVTAASDKAREMVNEEAAKLSASLNLPADMALPGI
jgi:DNA-binding YbaB/EbfC family protein